MKPTFVISSPFDTYSGYGARARDIIKAIIKTDKYDVKLLSQIDDVIGIKLLNYSIPFDWYIINSNNKKTQLKIENTSHIYIYIYI